MVVKRSAYNNPGQHKTNRKKKKEKKKDNKFENKIPPHLLQQNIYRSLPSEENAQSPLCISTL